jgi:hypothetical protein
MNITSKDIDNLQVLAVANVESRSVDFFVETCFRYYSKTYHTPLKDVRDSLNPLEVALIYFEDNYSDLNSQDQEDMRIRIIEVKKEIMAPDASLQTQAMDNDEWVAQLLAETERKDKEAEEKAKRAKEIIEKTDRAIAELNRTMQTVKDN